MSRQEFGPRSLDGGPPILKLDSYEVAEWCPRPNGEGQPTQLWLVLNLVSIREPLALRIKSATAADELIDTLIKHRNNVWPEYPRGDK